MSIKELVNRTTTSKKSIDSCMHYFVQYLIIIYVRKTQLITLS